MMHLRSSAVASSRRPGLPTRRGLILAAAAALSGCANTGNLLDDLLGNSDEPLKGKREPLYDAGEQAKEPVLLPAPVSIRQWLQPGGTASNVVGNPALAEHVSRRWRVRAAAPSKDANRISAPPLLVGDAVVVLDAFATVHAVDAASGRKRWQRPLTPKGERPESGFGGGICSDGRAVFAATGFGEVVALGAASGAELWRAKLPRPLRTPPVYDRGRIFVRDNGDMLHTLSAADGRQLWQYQGPAGQTRLISAAAPAVRGSLLVAPFSGGDIVALSTAGSERWSHTLSAAPTIADIAARPVVSARTVYAAAVLGDLAAVRAGGGEEVWSLPLGGRNTPWLAGNYLFHLAGRNALYAVHATTGKLRWKARLDASAHVGPIMAGGRLILANAAGALLEILAEGGQILKRHEVGAAVRVAPIAARGSLFVLDDEGYLSRFA